MDLSLVKPRYANARELFEAMRKAVSNNSGEKERVFSAFSSLNGYEKDEVEKIFENTERYFDVVKKTEEGLHRATRERNIEAYLSAARKLEKLYECGRRGEYEGNKIFTYGEIKMAGKNF